jgi:hypothetical protein
MAGITNYIQMIVVKLRERYSLVHSPPVRFFPVLFAAEQQYHYAR